MIKTFPRSAGRAPFVSLDGAVALLAAVSVAFVAFAMPTELFSRLVADSGLPSLVAAAEPPLGMKARLAVVAAGAVIAFIGVWALLRALDRAPVPRRRYDAIDLSAVGPKLRRADQHPDAPPRPPLFASRDFGEPLDDSASREGEYLPVGDDEPLELSVLASDPAPEPVLDAPPVSDGLSDPDPQAEPDIHAESETAPEITAEPAQPAALESLTAPLPDATDESVSNLMQRLEGGLVRRERSQTDQIEDVPAPAADQPAGHRLRSAINDLERITKRG